MKDCMMRPIGFLALLLLAAGSAGSQPVGALVTDPLELVDTIEVGGRPSAIVVDCWAGRNDVIFYGSSKVRFLDGNTLTLAPKDVLLPTDAWEGWIAYDRHHHHAYVLQVDTLDFWDGWDEVRVHVVSGRAWQASFSVNDVYNSPTPVDNFYYVDGLAFKQPLSEGLNSGRLIIDDTAHGQIDVVDLNETGTGAEQRHRYSYGVSLCSDTSCGHQSNDGNTLALETMRETTSTSDLSTTDVVYIADLNRKQPGGYEKGQVRAVRVNHALQPLGAVELPHVNLRVAWPFPNGNKGLAMAADRDILYVASGLQSFNDGYVGEVDTTDNQLAHVVTLPYGDQDRVHVDWYDSKRVFVTTFDGFYNDPQQGLYLQLVYDGAVVDSLLLKAGADKYDDEPRGMAFDPYHRRLYLLVDSTIMVLQVNYGADPPSPDFDGTITPAGGTLASEDGSAVLEFPAGAVDEDTLVTYEVVDPLPVSPLTGARFFDLSAVLSAGGTPVTGFDPPYTLTLSYLEGGIGAAIESTLGLYCWDGGAWVEQPSTLDQLNNTVTASLDFVSTCALLGETNRTFLPLVLRNR